MQVTNTFSSCKIFVYVPFYCFTFQAPTYWNCHLHKPLLPRWIVSVVIGFLISDEVQTRYSKTLKYSQHLRPFIRYQGNNFDLLWIWCCFQFFLHCLVQPKQVIYFLCHIIFIIRIRLWIFQTVHLYFVCFWNIAP